MPYALSDLDALKAAIVSPENEVEIAGRRVRYNSVSDIQKAISIVEADLAGQGLLDRPVRRKTLASTNSNFSGCERW